MPNTRVLLFPLRFTADPQAVAATRCRVEDCLAVALKALTRPRIPLRVS